MYSTRYALGVCAETVLFFSQNKRIGVVHAFLIAEVLWLERVRTCALFTQMLTFYHVTSDPFLLSLAFLPALCRLCYVQYHTAILSIGHFQKYHDTLCLSLQNFA